MSVPSFQWPEASYPDHHLPTVEDRLTAQDQGVVFWVPLDYLHGKPLGSGYWQFTSPQGYRTGGAEEPTIRLGGRDLHPVELRAGLAHLINRRFPHLTAVLHQVTTTDGGPSSTASFPAYIVH